MAVEAIARMLPGNYQVVAEISEISARSSGHCYLTFIEKGYSGDIIAKVPAHCWRSKWAAVDTRFRQATSQALEAGMKVLATVEVELHVQYGYALNVLDIDPSYTLGEQARRRQETIRQLKEDGVFDMQRDLLIPRPLMRLAVVSSPTAAGYGDFCKQLEQSGYAFGIELLEAVMQGTSAPASIIAALEQIAAKETNYDAVIIIRGGGAVDDLMCFDDYELSATIAQMPLPVFTGIGHERDTSVADMVASRSFKTPTAVAAFLIAARDEEFRTIDELRIRLERSVANFQQAQRFALHEIASRLRLAVVSRMQHERTDIDRIDARLRMAVAQRLATERLRIEALNKQLILLNPQHILDRGYSLTICNGRVVRSATELKAGDTLITRFKQGQAESRVAKIN